MEVEGLEGSESGEGGMGSVLDGAWAELEEEGDELNADTAVV